MKKILLSFVSAFALAALVAAPALAASNGKATDTVGPKKLSESSITICKNRVALIDELSPKYMDQFKKDYLVAPTLAELDAYPLVKIVDIDGNNPEAHSQYHNVQYYKSGKLTTTPAKQARNFGVALLYHSGALDRARAAGVDQASIDKYAAAIEKLGAAASPTKVDTIQGDWDKKKTAAGSINCGTKAGQNRALNLIKERGIVLGKLSKVIKGAATEARNTSKAYKDISKAYQKKLQATPSSSHGTYNLDDKLKSQLAR